MRYLLFVLLLICGCSKVEVGDVGPGPDDDPVQKERVNPEDLEQPEDGDE